MNKLREMVRRIIKEEKSILIENKKTKSKTTLIEYIVREGDNLDELGSLNLFTDFAEGQMISQYEDDFKSSKKWMSIEKKYSKIANLLWKIIERNKNVELDEDDVEMIENSWYDGSDLYGSPEEACSGLPEIYNSQIEVIKDIFANHGIK